MTEVGTRSAEPFGPLSELEAGAAARLLAQRPMGAGELERLLMQRHPLASKLLTALLYAAALATIPVVVLQVRGDKSLLLSVADWSTWLVFLLDYGAKIWLSEYHWPYARANWLNAAVIALSFPVLPGGFGAIRVLRFARLARLTRIVVVAVAGIRAVRLAVPRPQLIVVLCITLLVIVTGGTALSIVEPKTVHGFTGGVWWAAVAVTSVGLGGTAPETPIGRVIAFVTMLCGLALVSTLSATIAAFFVNQDEAADFRSLTQRLDRIEALLTEQRKD